MSNSSNINFSQISLFIILIFTIFQNIYSEESDFKGKYPEFIDRLKNNKFQKIVFLVGAGISTSAGIPDFRSKKGIFNKIKQKYNLGSPRDFFDINFFYKNPSLFYEFSKEFIIETYKPTLFHYFMSFINHKNLLYYIFTQNIDNLESHLNIDKDKIIFARGNLYEASCP